MWRRIRLDALGITRHVTRSSSDASKPVDIQGMNRCGTFPKHLFVSRLSLQVIILDLASFYHTTNQSTNHPPTPPPTSLLAYPRSCPSVPKVPPIF